MVQISDDILKAVPISEDELRQEIAVLLYRKGLYQFLEITVQDRPPPPFGVLPLFSGGEFAWWRNERLLPRARGRCPAGSPHAQLCCA